MIDEDKTKKQLITELTETRQRMAELAASESRHRQLEEELHKSTEQWRETFDAITDIVALISPDMEFIKVNKAGCDSLGLSPEEIVGKKCYEIVHQSDEPLFACPCNRTLKTGEACSNEIAQYGRHYIATADPIFDEGGEMTGFVHTIKDITERRQAEEALEKANDELEKRVDQRTLELLESNRSLQQEIVERRRVDQKLRDSEEKFRNLAEQSPNMIFINKNGRVVYVNRKCEEIMGYKREEIYSPDFDFLALIGEESRDLVKTSFGRHIEGEEISPYEYKLVTKDGKEIDAIITTKLMQYEGDIAILGIVTDITERKQAEEELWNTNELLETIFFTTRLMIVYVDIYFNFVRVNRAYAMANGHTPEFFVGKNYLDLYPNKYHESLLHRVIDKDRPYFAYARPLELGEGNERIKYWDWNIHPVKDPSGYPKGLIMLFLDVTEHKRMEEQLRWSQKMESVGRLAAGVAHEIGNPLNSISSLVQLLGMKSEDVLVRDNLQLMRTHIDRISKIVRNMTDFAHPVSNQVRSTQVNDVLNAALEISKYDERAKNIQLTMDSGSGIDPVFLVEDQLLQVFTNIILNAFDAIQDRGRLTISSWQESDRVHISFEDTGTGIKEDIISNVFDPFFTTKDIGQGTGLGLSISYGIIKSFGGEITAQSTYGSGSTFTVILPVTRTAGEENG
ncbi:PAS domain S-box protein [Candidatus Poribacteria bacterium]